MNKRCRSQERERDDCAAICGDRDAMQGNVEDASEIAVTSSEEVTSSLSVKVLKKIIAAHGGSIAGCVEKGDLVREAKRAIDAKKASASASGLRKFGDLNCHVYYGGKEKRPESACIMFHGYGAEGSQFVDLFKMLDGLVGENKVMWIAPEAPNNMWWPLDLSEWQMAMMAGGDAIAKLLRKTPPGLSEARSSAIGLLNAVSSECGIPISSIFVGGFSQGSMLAVDASLSLPKGQNVAGIGVFSGFPIVVDEWAAKAKEHPGIEVLQTHGRSDPLLPFVAAGWLRDLLTTNGLSVTFKDHAGGHDLGSPDIFQFIASFLKTSLK